MGVLDQLSNIMPDDLGLAMTKDGASVVFDLPDILVVGLPLHATAFNVPDGVLIEWSEDWGGSLRQVGYRPFAREILARGQLSIMDLFFNIANDYGGFALEEGDHDDTAAPFELMADGWMCLVHSDSVNRGHDA